MSVGAASIAILASLPKSEADEIMECNVDKITNTYPELSMEKIQTLVTEARIQGWALNPGLAFPGSWAIAAAVRDPEGRVLGAITIAAIETRLELNRQLALAGPLMKEARHLEKLMLRAREESRPAASLLTNEVRNIRK